MRNLAKALVLLALPLVAGCGNGSEVYTDPSKLPPLTAEQQKGVREADDQVAAEENSNPVQGVRAKGKRPGLKK